MSLHHEVAVLTEALTKKCAVEFPHDAWTITIQRTPFHKSHNGVQVRLEVRYLLSHQDRTWTFTRETTPSVDVDHAVQQIKEKLYARRKR